MMLVVGGCGDMINAIACLSLFGGRTLMKTMVMVVVLVVALAYGVWRTTIAGKPT